MRKKLCIAMITHKEELEGYEDSSLRNLYSVCGERDIFLVVPESINMDYFLSANGSAKFKKVPKEWLESWDKYNQTLMTPEFYRLFSDYEYVLIYQTDCWLFYDKLDYYVSLGLDYYGAAWPHDKDIVGNGGLCLRKVDKMIDVCERHKNEAHLRSEDIWFSKVVNKEINFCDLKTACNFSCESLPRHYCKLIDDIPMGVHGKVMLQYWGDGSLLRNKIAQMR